MNPLLFAPSCLACTDKFKFTKNKVSIMNFKNFMMWGVIVLLVVGLFQLFQNPKNTAIPDKMPFSEFLKNIDDGRVVQDHDTGLMLPALDCQTLRTLSNIQLCRSSPRGRRRTDTDTSLTTTRTTRADTITEGNAGAPASSMARSIDITSLWSRWYSKCRTSTSQSEPLPWCSMHHGGAAW